MNTDESHYVNDGKFRTYVSHVERCLKGFEYSSEWADLITNLTKLIKVLQANAKYPVIPKKHIIGKRLCQCLHPSLPSGVHIRALECYDVIFKNIGPKTLADDLFVYCTGLFPLMSPSATNVKGPLFDLYENHFLPLNKAVRPAFDGLLQGLLPGLEEGTEFYERGNQILERFCVSVEPVYFYTALWHVMLQAPSIRLFGTTFLINHFNKKKSVEDQLYLFGNNINMMLSSLTQLLNDSQALVQRQSLDFVLLALQLHKTQLTKSDNEKLCAACLSVLLRRDMSLNRRFYGWLMGANLEKSSLLEFTPVKDKSIGDQSSSLIENELQIKYFKKYSRSILIASIRLIVSDNFSIPNEKRLSIKPFRIIMTLMDRSDIGSDIIEDVLLDLIIYMEKEYHYIGRQTVPIQNSQHAQQQTQVLTTAKKVLTQQEFLKMSNLFFANLEGGFFWGFITGLLQKTFDKTQLGTDTFFHEQQHSLERICGLLEFVLKNLPIETYSEVHSCHLPNLLWALSQLIENNVHTMGMMAVELVLRIYRFVFSQIIQHEKKVFKEQNVANIMESDAKNKSKKVPTTNPSRHSTSSVSEDLPQNKISKIVQMSIYKFREFFQKFCHSKLGYKSEHMDNCASQIFGTCNKSALKSRTINSSMNSPSVLLEPNSIKLDMSVDQHTIQVYTTICQVIIEMNSYPVCASSELGGYFAIFSDEEEKLEKCTSDNYSIPRWFVSLIISGCFVDSFHIKTESMSTILQLIHTSRSLLGAHSNRDSNNQHHNGNQGHRRKSNSIKMFGNNADDNESSVIVNFPVLSPKLMNELDQRSCFYNYAGLSLWHYLSESHPHFHQTTVEMIYKLHQTSPNNCCEDMILHKLLSESNEDCLDGHRRFILLWQLLSKNKSASDQSSGAKSVRNFDKCMLVLLDGVDSQNEVLRTMCHSWLESSFQQYNCHETLLTPLIMGILKPDTARVSLEALVKLSSSSAHQLSGHRDDDGTDYNDDSGYARQGSLNDLDARAIAEERRIYAISSDHGNIKYHLKSKPVEEPCKRSESPKMYQDSPETANHKVQISSHQSGKNVSNKGASESEVINKMDEVMTSVVSDKVLDENSSDIDSNIGDELDTPNNSETQTERDKLEMTELSNENQEIQFSGQSNYILPLHRHFLIYCTPIDSSCIIYSLSRLKAIIKSISPGVFVAVLHNLIGGNTTNNNQINYCLSQPTKIYELLARHQNALRGNNFYQNPTIEEIDFFKSFNLLEIILVICNWLLRSYYTISSNPNNNSHIRENADDNNRMENKKVQMMAGEIIDLLVQEMLHILQVGYVNYRGDFVSKSCSAQEIKEKFRSTFNTKTDIAQITLHTMACSITRLEGHSDYLSDTIFMYNENILDEKIRDSFQISLFRLVLNVLKLDYGLNSQFVLASAKNRGTSNGEQNSASKLAAGNSLSAPTLKKDLFLTTYISNSLSYTPVSRQSILLTSIVACLGASQLRHLHSHCYNFLISSLGVWGQSTTPVLVHVVKRLCRNIRITAETVEKYNDIGDTQHTGIENCQKREIIPDYGVTTLQCLKAICHFLLLDKALKCYQIQEEKGNASEHSLLSSLFNRNKESSTEKDEASPSTHILEARQNMLHLIPQVMRSIIHLWEALSMSKQKNESRTHPCWIMGDPHTIHSLILTIIKPLLKQHSSAILISIGRVWPNLNQFLLNNEQLIDPYIIHDLCIPNNTETSGRDTSGTLAKEKFRTKCILEFARGWETVFPLDNIILASKDILKKSLFVNSSNPGNMARKKYEEEQESLIKENLLEFIQCLLVSLGPSAMKHMSGHLFTLLRETVGILSANASFILFKILSDFLSKIPISDERKEQRELQDLCHKIIEQVAVLGGSSLEQPTWFRRTAQVRVEEPNNAVNGLINTNSPRPDRALKNGEVSNTASPSTQQITQKESSSTIAEESNMPGIPSNSPIYVRNTPQESSVIKDDFGAGRSGSPANNSGYPDLKQSRHSIASASGLSGSNTLSGADISRLNVSSTASSKTVTIQALQLQAMHLASIIDVIYKSEEKERVQPFLNSSILPNLTPYLRFRSFGNILNLRVASQLMASLSGYQHTRRSWKKEIFDLFFESYFFQLDLESLRSWKIIIDNLMAQDKVIFKEAFTKLQVTQGGGLNLFSSKEAEYEQSAVCLRKLAFIIYSSEPDQYVKSLPEIQERLSNSLQNGMVPQIYTQLFLFFRILLLRMSPQAIISIWYILMPIIISSIQFLIEQLKSVTNSPKAFDFSKFLPMFLSMAKVVDLILILPEDKVPQFLFYKWSLLGYVEEIETGIAATKFEELSDYEIPLPYEFNPTFQPLLNVVADSFNYYLKAHKISSSSVHVNWPMVTSASNQSLILYKDSIQDITELASFFITVVLRNETNPDVKARYYTITIDHDLNGTDDFATGCVEEEAEKVIDLELIDKL